MEIIVKQNRETVKQKMSDILLDVSWAKISERYFGHGFIIKWME